MTNVCLQEIVPGPASLVESVTVTNKTSYPSHFLLIFSQNNLTIAEAGIEPATACTVVRHDCTTDATAPRYAKRPKTSFIKMTSKYENNRVF